MFWKLISMGCGENSRSQSIGRKIRQQLEGDMGSRAGLFFCAFG